MRQYRRINLKFFIKSQINQSDKYSKRKSSEHKCSKLSLVGEGGFEPPKAVPADLQSVPFGLSGILPYKIGAGDRSRTNNLLITNQLLCH